MNDAQSDRPLITRKHLRVLIFFSGAIGGLVTGILYVLVIVLPMVAQIREEHPNYYDPTVVIFFAFIYASIQGVIYGLASALTGCLFAMAAVRLTPSASVEVMGTALGAALGIALIFLVLPPAFETFRVGYVSIAGAFGVLWFSYLTMLYRKAESRTSLRVVERP